MKRTDGELHAYALQLCEERLAAYSAAPHDAEEHANIELSVLAGGYAYRQVAELVQNAADAIAEATTTAGETGRIVIKEDRLGLWSANTGAPVDRAGIKALLNAHASGKRAGQIGRFGLGFKSLLRLGGRIDVLSRNVCLRFDPEACRNRIREHLRLASGDPAPGLRLATPIAWEEAIAGVEGATQFDWATTIVFAELASTGAREAIADEIRRFPAEFLLFLPCDIELSLLGKDIDRRLRRRSEPDGVVTIEDLSGKGTSQRWRVFSTSVRITDQSAIDDATSVHARETIPLIWAAPIDAARDTAGRFFAFFPTTTETRTLGILNAPWKLNSDRTALIPGAWNAALMAHAADLIVDRLPELSTTDDPGGVLDAFPRELQTQMEPAVPLVNALWSRLQSAAVVPNIDGVLCPPADLRRAPIESPDLIKKWSRIAEPEACESHLHGSCTSSAARAGRLNQLADRIAPTRGESDGKPRLTKTSLLDWLESVASNDPDAAVEALLLANACAGSVPGYQWDAIRDRIRLILTSDGTLSTAPDVTLSEVADPPLKSVHEVLRSDPEARKILVERFRVRDLSDTDWERLLDIKVAAAERTEDWKEVWTLLRALQPQTLRDCLEDRSISVYTRAGWRHSSQVFRLGSFLSEDDVRGPEPGSIRGKILNSLILDEKWHRGDSAILLALAVTEVPASIWSDVHAASIEHGPHHQWFWSWHERGVMHYFSKLQKNSRPDRTYIGPVDLQMPACWPLFLLVDGPALSKVTKRFLRTILTANTSQFGPVIFRHSTRAGAYPSEIYAHPLAQLIVEKGTLRNAGSQIRIDMLLCSDLFETLGLLPSLSEHIESLKKVRLNASPRKNGPTAVEAWPALLDYAANENVDPNALTKLWQLASAAGFVPQAICTPNGPLPIEKVRIATTIRDARLACEAGVVAVGLDSEAAQRWRAAGATLLDHESRLVTEGNSEASLLLEVEPAIREALRPDIAESAGVVFADVLEKSIGDRRYPVDWAVEAGQLYIRREAYFLASWPNRIKLLLEAADGIGWTVANDPLDQVLRSGVDARRRAVASEPDLPRRLLNAIGDPSVILNLFESDVRRELEADVTRAASVALTLFGPALLTVPAVRDAMLLTGLQPPDRWGGEQASEFVAAIGFPTLYSTSPTRKREPEILISGPVPLKPLHDFQTEVVASLDALMSDTNSKRRRAVISLPTGAGKTRVAGEWAVKRVLSSNKSNRLVLWIAQTDELCEQAVQCFREIWTNLGTPDESLRIVRFWGGQANPIAPEFDEPTVIVASIQTLNSRLNDSQLAWAANPALLVIDECHHALTPSYTGILKWFHPDAAVGEREPVIVGLSATPFRGRNDDESRQLANRFDGRLIPKNQSRLYDMLQSRGVLARLDYTRLDIVAKFELTEQEEQRLRTFHTLPDTALERLGENSERNDRILDAIVAARDKSALVFATSVAHAQRLAARLNVMGVSAAAVSGDTDPTSRRWFIKSFIDGNLQVLCNHSALTTGFDAPATDLIVIARPVFSPSLYMQMVGRGMRGPVNGGKARCRILTVQDNLDQFTDMLAHHYFEQHYMSVDN